MIKENVYYEVENEEEAKWIVNKMYKEGYNWIDGSNRSVTDYYKEGYSFKYCIERDYIRYNTGNGRCYPTIKVSTLMTPPMQSAYARNINVETSEYVIKKVSKYIINVYARIDDKKKLIDSLNIDNPKLKEIMSLYGIILLDVRKLNMNDFIGEMAENRDVKNVSVLFDNNDIEIYMKDGRVLRPIEMGIEVI